jgi:hypothetical protein
MSTMMSSALELRFHTLGAQDIPAAHEIEKDGELGPVSLCWILFTPCAGFPPSEAASLDTMR